MIFLHSGETVETPVSWCDYPNTYRGFVEMFPDDTALRHFWLDYAGLKDLFVRPARQPQFHGTNAVAVWRVQCVVIKHP